MSLALRAPLHLLRNWLLKFTSMPSVVIIQCLILLVFIIKLFLSLLYAFCLLACKARVHAFITYKHQCLIFMSIRVVLR